MGITVGFKICGTTTVIKNYKSMIKKKNRKKRDRIALLAKIELNAIEVLISKVLIDSNVSHD